jgi:hypothetical protein
MAPEPTQRHTSQIPPISLCVCMCIPPIVARQRIGKVFPFFVARQRLGKHISAAANTRSTRRGSVYISPIVAE